VENVGQVVFQDGRSADHGFSGSPSSINSNFHNIYIILQHSNYRRLGKRIVHNVCKLIVNHPFYFNAMRKLTFILLYFKLLLANSNLSRDSAFSFKLILLSKQPECISWPFFKTFFL